MAPSLGDKFVPASSEPDLHPMPALPYGTRSCPRAYMVLGALLLLACKILRQNNGVGTSGLSHTLSYTLWTLSKCRGFYINLVTSLVLSLSLAKKKEGKDARQLYLQTLFTPFATILLLFLFSPCLSLLCLKYNWKKAKTKVTTALFPWDRNGSNPTLLKPEDNECQEAWLLLQETWKVQTHSFSRHKERSPFIVLPSLLPATG